MNPLLQYNYLLGVKRAMTEYGISDADREEEAEQQLPMEQLTGDSAGAAGMGVPDADAFVQFTEQDQTPDNINATLPKNTDEKPIHWGGKASLESGDAGTRNHAMGQPSFGGV